MSKLQDLIRELCPNGVEYKELGEIVTIKNGRDYKHLGKGNIPVYGSGGIMTYVDAYSYNKPTVLIPRKGSLGNLFYVDTPFWNVDTIFYTEVDTQQIDVKYLYYLLAKEHLENLNKAGEVPSLTQSILNKIMLPVPPLPVQEEIVRILDHFTNLAAELQAELQARKEQYEYYRNKLLMFDKIGGGTQSVTWMKMSEIGTFIRGNGLQKKDFTESGVPCIHYGQIYTYYGTFASKTKSFVSEETAKKCKKAHTGDLVIASTSENVEDVGKTVAWLGEEDIAISNHTLIFSHNQNPKYLSYLFQTEWFIKYKRRKAVGVKVIDIPQKALEDLCIPIPPLTEQERIVSVLDKFEALVNDLTEGLPAEIAAAQEQYEYYRNKLLSFPRTKISA